MFAYIEKSAVYALIIMSWWVVWNSYITSDMDKTIITRKHTENHCEIS